VLYWMKRATMILALASLTMAGLWAQAQQKTPEFKDRQEYDIFTQVQKEAQPTGNANTLLQLLDQWKQKYPDSNWDEVRMGIYVSAYRMLNSAAKMWQAAKDLVAKYPKDLTGLYNLTFLTIHMNDKSPDTLDTGEKAAKGFLGIMDEIYDPSKKPQNLTEDQWKQDRKNNEALAHKSLGWIAMQREKWEDAEKEFLEVLHRTPGDGQVSSWVGTCILRQKKFERQSAGLYFFCRAGMYDGPGALAEKDRKALLAYVEKTYVSFHGDKSGLDELLARCKTEPLPPDAPWKIKSKEEIILENEEKLKAENPQLYLWLTLKKGLTGSDPQAFFNDSMKGQGVPGGVPVGDTKVDKFKATIISTKAPPKGPKTQTKEIVVGIASKQDPEITLRFETPVSIKAEPGTEIEFSGVPAEFTQDPFNVTFDVELDDIKGVEKLAPAPPKKAPAPKKPAAPATKK